MSFTSLGKPSYFRPSTAQPHYQGTIVFTSGLTAPEGLNAADFLNATEQVDRRYR